MSGTIVRNDSAGVPVVKEAKIGQPKNVSVIERRAELVRNYSSVKIMSPVVGSKTDSARISAAVDAVMERKNK